MTKHEKIFSHIYDTSFWGKNKSSGTGSITKSLDFYIPFLRNFIILNNIKSVLDLGCGDFYSGDRIYSDLQVKYFGYDVYLEHIENHKKKYLNDTKFNFVHLDFFEYKEKIIDSELFILKDVLQHWSNKEIDIFLSFFIKNINFKYLLITNAPDINGNRYSADKDLLEKPNLKHYKDEYGEYVMDEPDKVDIETGGWRSLSANVEPLKKYNPIILFVWGKDHFFETSLIVKK